MAYFAIPRDSILEFGPLTGNANNLVIGLCLGLALFLIGAGAIQWAKKLMVDTEISEDRHDAFTSPEKKAEIIEAFQQGAAESGFTRRKLIRRSLIGAMGLLGLPAIVLLRDLGPLPGRSLYNTIWAKGIRVVNDVTLRPIKPSDLVVGQLVNAAPANLAPIQEESAVEYQNAKAKAAVIVVRIEPDKIRPPRAGRTGASTGSCATPRSAPTSAARSRCTSRPPTTCSARATSRRSTWPTAPRSSSALPPGRCLSYRWQWTRRATWSRRAASPSRSARASGNEGDNSVHEGTSRRRSSGSTTGWASARSARRTCARSSPTTGRSCSARSRSTASSSCS